ncbi:BfmA/BtgA family mobilization protein [Tamlana sp. 2_MG-2023]|uniref:BfmA/BtgA family mobilization protein n=1 Tax=unclassified Tamlana TaxID=2614803 RepID=UPI0026E39AF6|nr:MULTISPECIES: BfmA/BtgA family mobilization protein [unclassified Tamlana]MDO6761641.1 BfmA/BtgA family mobilization protein [Tamlana sp. 2_MG-2023]MDO6792467.1 BfmA/BtgA family mobilization protein [Tamlana sp. 1_MG-2023]
MDKGYEKERFEKLGIKVSVANRFREFCKKMSKSQSMTLLMMLDFFEENGISPHEKIGPNMQTLELEIKKRINAVIAIIKDIEKHHDKPTTAMLQSLFMEFEPKEKKLILEKDSKEKKVQFVEKIDTNNQM